MHKKQLYMAPEAEPLVVQIEGVICESGSFPINGFTDDELGDITFDTLL